MEAEVFHSFKIEWYVEIIQLLGATIAFSSSFFPIFEIINLQ